MCGSASESLFRRHRGPALIKPLFQRYELWSVEVYKLISHFHDVFPLYQSLSLEESVPS